MTLQTLNTILTVSVIIFVVNGFFQGIIHMIGSIAGLIIGVAVAGRWDDNLGAWLHLQTGWNENICVILGFIIILILFTRVFGVILHILEKTFKFMKIPLVGIANRAAGGILGFFEGVLVVGATLIVVKKLTFPIAKTMTDSILAASLMSAASLLLPLLPKSIRQLYQV